MSWTQLSDFTFTFTFKLAVHQVSRIMHLITEGLYPWLTSFRFSQSCHQPLLTIPLLSLLQVPLFRIPPTRISCSICLSISGLFHFAYYSPGSPVWLQMVELNSLFKLNTISICFCKAGSFMFQGGRCLVQVPSVESSPGFPDNRVPCGMYWGMNQWAQY